MDSEDVVITVKAAKDIRRAARKSKLTRKEIEGIILKSQQGDKKAGKKKMVGKGAGSVGGVLLDENRLRKFCAIR